MVPFAVGLSVLVIPVSRFECVSGLSVYRVEIK